MQLADRSELAGLAALLQEATGNDWPIVTAGAGLPVMREPEHAVTYFERATWHELGLLDREGSIDALEGPATRAGRPLDPDAADLLATEAGGYPYAIQVYGHYAWRASDGEDRITLEAAAAGRTRAARALAQGLYAGRWSAATPSQRAFLTAVARLTVDGAATTGRAVADAMERTTRQLSSVRNDLLRQGTLTVDGDELRFTVPGMAEWVHRAAADDGADRRQTVTAGHGRPGQASSVWPAWSSSSWAMRSFSDSGTSSWQRLEITMRSSASKSNASRQGLQSSRCPAMIVRFSSVSSPSR